MSAPWIAAFTALSASVVLLGLIVLGTLRRVAPLIERAEASLVAAEARAAPGALSTGAAVPPFVAEAIDGPLFTERDLREARTVALFLGGSCSACERLVDDLQQNQVPDLGARLVAVTQSANEARRLARSDDATVVIDEDRSLAGVFESEIVPHTFVVDNGTVRASGRPNTWDGIRDLLSDAKEGGGLQADFAAEALASQS